MRAISLVEAVSVVLLGGGMLVGCAAEEPTDPAVALFNSHVRAHFEDIHEVSMRFHMSDPSIGGRIALAMVWVDGRLESARAVENETGSDDEVAALIDAMQGWYIKGIQGRREIAVTFAIELVGSDDPDFPQTAILTGSVHDAEGRPLSGAAITLVPRDRSREQIEGRCNREGIFVRTLIPPGVWDLTVRDGGHAPVTISSLDLEAGRHRIEHVVLGVDRPVHERDDSGFPSS